MVSTPNTMDEAGIDWIINGNLASTGTLTATSNTTYATVPGFNCVVQIGTYIITGHLTGVSGATGGLKVQLSTTATVGTASITTGNYNGTTQNALTTITALTSALTSQAAIYTDLYIDGVIVFTEPGVLSLQAAQLVSNSTSTTVLVNSYLSITRVS